MKYLLTCLFLVFLTASLSAREDKTKIAPTREVVGMSCPGNVPLYGQHFVFPCEIINAFFDAGREEVTLLLKVPQKNTDFGLKGYLLVVDLKTNSVKWSRKVSAFGLAQGYDGILSWGMGPIICYDRNTGEKLWKRPASNVAYVDKKKNVAYSTDVDAIDMKTGKGKWSYEHYGRGYWESVTCPDDTTMIVSSGGGIMGINTNTGKGWQYSVSDSKADALPVVAAAAGIGLGLLTGFMAVPLLTGNPKQGMRSQLLFEDRNIFLANRKKIARMSIATGAKLWETALPNSTSQSALASYKGNIIMVNKGVAERASGDVVLSGHPYIASFAKDSGRQNYFFDITSYGPVFREDLSNDTLSLLFARHIAKYNAVTGKQLFSKTIELRDTNDAYLFFVNASNLYMPDGAGSYISLADRYPASEFLNTNTDSIIIYNKQFEAPKYARKSEMVSEYDSVAGFHMLADHKSVIVMKNNKKAAAIALTRYAECDGKRIYFIRDNSLYVVDLGSLDQK
jgi:outer membrane protein assembly factor BamB